MVIPTLRWKFPEVPGLYDQLQEIIEALKNINKDNFKNYPDLSGVSLQNILDLSTNSVSIGGYSIGSSEASYIDGMDQALKTSDSPTFDDLTLSNPSNIYDLSHDSFADFLADEHIDWTVSQSPTVIHADNYTQTSISSVLSSIITYENNVVCYEGDVVYV